MDRNYDVITFVSKSPFILRRPGVTTIFGGIIKIVTIFINTIYKNSKKS